MRHFSRELKFVDEDPTICRTVMITGIGKKFCQDDKLRRHFEYYKYTNIARISQIMMAFALDLISD